MRVWAGAGCANGTSSAAASGSAKARMRRAVMGGPPARRRSILEEAVLRARQAEVLAQRPAFVLAAEEAAALQLRHHAVDEIVETARQVGEHDGEPVRAVRLEPLLHLVGDRLRRADYREARIAAEPLRELAHGEVLAPGKRDRALAPALARVALGDLRQRSVGIELGSVVAERDRERGDRIGV